MPHELQKEIEIHLATYPERRKDVTEMQGEWREFKQKAFWAMATFICSILGVGIWVGTIQSNIQNIQHNANKAVVVSEQLDKRLQSLEVNNGEIKARLTSIDVTLQEIKLSIRGIPR